MSNVFVSRRDSNHILLWYKFKNHYLTPLGTLIIKPANIYWVLNIVRNLANYFLCAIWKNSHHNLTGYHSLPHLNRKIKIKKPKQERNLWTGTTEGTKWESCQEAGKGQEIYRNAFFLLPPFLPPSPQPILTTPNGEPPWGTAQQAPASPHKGWL